MFYQSFGNLSRSLRIVPLRAFLAALRRDVVEGRRLASSVELICVMPVDSAVAQLRMLS